MLVLFKKYKKFAPCASKLIHLATEKETGRFFVSHFQCIFTMYQSCYLGNLWLADYTMMALSRTEHTRYILVHFVVIISMISKKDAWLMSSTEKYIIIQ